MAGRAADHAHVFFELLLLHLALAGLMLAGKFGNDPLELTAIHHRRLPAAPGERDVFLAGTIQPYALLFSRQLVPRRVEQRAALPLVLALERVGHALIDVSPPATQFVP